MFVLSCHEDHTFVITVSLNYTSLHIKHYQMLDKQTVEGTGLFLACMF